MYEVSWLLTFVLLAAITMSTYAQTTNCREGFTAVVGSCYKLVKIEGNTSYQIGLRACKSLGETVSLATIRCAEQNQGLLNLTVEAEKQGLFERREAGYYPNQLIIGLVNFTDNDPQTGRFPNEREPPYTYRNWGPNQPSGADYNENITQFLIDTVDDGAPGMWNDIVEETKQWGAICEEIVPTSRDGCDMTTTTKPTTQTTRHTTVTPKPTTATTTATQTGCEINGHDLPAGAIYKSHGKYYKCVRKENGDEIEELNPGPFNCPYIDDVENLIDGKEISPDNCKTDDVFVEDLGQARKQYCSLESYISERGWAYCDPCSCDKCGGPTTVISGTTSTTPSSLPPTSSSTFRTSDPTTSVPTSSTVATTRTTTTQPTSSSTFRTSDSTTTFPTTRTVTPSTVPTSSSTFRTTSEITTTTRGVTNTTVVTPATSTSASQTSTGSVTTTPVICPVVEECALHKNVAKTRLCGLGETHNCIEPAREQPGLSSDQQYVSLCENLAAYCIESKLERFWKRLNVTANQPESTISIMNLQSTVHQLRTAMTKRQLPDVLASLYSNHMIGETLVSAELWDEWHSIIRAIVLSYADPENIGRCVDTLKNCYLTGECSLAVEANCFAKFCDEDTTSCKCRAYNDGDVKCDNSFTQHFTSLVRVLCPITCGVSDKLGENYEAGVLPSLQLLTHGNKLCV